MCLKLASSSLRTGEWPRISDTSSSPPSACATKPGIRSTAEGLWMLWKDYQPNQISRFEDYFWEMQEDAREKCLKSLKLLPPPKHFKKFQLLRTRWDYLVDTHKHTHTFKHTHAHIYVHAYTHAQTYTCAHTLLNVMYINIFRHLWFCA